MAVSELEFSLEERLFHISPKGSEKPDFEMPAADWLLPAKAAEALRVSGELASATGMQLPASFAGMSLFNLCMTRLMCLARYDRLPDLSLERLTFQLEKVNGYTYFGYRIDEVCWTPMPGADRDAFAAADWTRFFRHNINPAIQSIADNAGVKPDLIWNQFGGQLVNMGEYVRHQETSALFHDRLDSEIAVLTDRLTADVFDRKRNPFQHRPRYIENPWQPERRMIVRSSCCMYDCRVDGQKCYNCPRLTPEEREQKREMITAQTVK